MGLENTPPASPGVGGLDDDDQIYDDEIAEEIDVGEGVMEVRCQIQINTNVMTLPPPRLWRCKHKDSQIDSHLSCS